MATFPRPTPPDGSAPPQQAHSLNDLLKLYEREYFPAKAPITQYQQRGMFVTLRTQLGWRPLTDFTPAFLRQWRADLSAAGYAPGTIRRWMDCLSHPFTIAVRDLDWLKENPFRKVQKPPLTPGRVRFLSDEERVRLLAACKVSRNPHLYVLVLLALSTGARKHQLLELRWRDVDCVRAVLRVGVSKKAPRRTIALSGPVLALLQQRQTNARPEAWVFARHDGLKPILVDFAFQTACKRAGIADFVFHDLRHTAASYLAMNGASLREIQEVLGHATPTITARYAHLTQDHTADVLGRMVSKMFEDGSPPAAPQ